MIKKFKINKNKNKFRKKIILYLLYNYFYVEEEVTSDE